MDTKVLRYFVDVAKLGSFAAVARKYELDPSSVSRLIASLEDELNSRLLHRTTRSQSLTEAGEEYLRYVEPLLDELERAGDNVNYFSDEPVGRLRLAASVAFGNECLVPLIAEFRQLYPKIDIEFILSDANVNLIKENIDLSVRLGRTIDSDLVVTKLMPTHYRVLASPAYLESHPELSNPEQLREHQCILFTDPNFRSTWLFKNQNAEINEVQVSGGLSFSNALALREAVKQGLGPGLIANWMSEKELEEGTLVDVFPRYRATATNFETAAWLIYPTRTFLPRKVRLMIDYLKSRLSD